MFDVGFIESKVFNKISLLELERRLNWIFKRID